MYWFILMLVVNIKHELFSYFFFFFFSSDGKSGIEACDLCYLASTPNH